MSGKAASNASPPAEAPPAPSSEENRGSVETWRICLTGHVQGVGFRPFVYRLARAHGIAGWVRNQLGEVEIRARAGSTALAAFRDALIAEAPPLSRPVLTAVEPAPDESGGGFRILESAASESPRIFVPPDYFMCDDCRRELADPADRRYRYPFINCTQCGPRYTLIRALPYDRPNTSMAGFPLCGECEREYLDPSDRRFHAEPVACPACGPSLTLSAGGETEARGDEALSAAVARLSRGQILAVRGIGGYHLMCDAADAAAVARLRERKPRPHKPLAVMFPLAGANGLAAVDRSVRPGADEAAELLGPVRPIVLVARREDCPLAGNLAPGLAELGVFLPYSPLHQLLTADFGGPLVATSGNISGEPVLTDVAECERRLARVADAFLHHDRPIVRPADDPVVRRIGSRLRPLRIGRGSAPRELTLPLPLARPTLAVGGHMKNTLALAWEDRAVVSPHIGDMGTPRSLRVFEQVAAELQSLYGVAAERVVADAHTGYDTHRWARRSGLPMSTVWHHHAHASALAAEFGGGDRWLVFAWDGVGLGEDGTLWGGEALVGAPGAWRRVASMRTIALPGGERAGREPWRSAAAMHWECGLDYAGGPADIGLAHGAWRHGLNSPRTSAVGRLFDGAAAMICGIETASFEAQGPMALEALSGEHGHVVELPLQRDEDGIWRTDWAPLLPILDDAERSPADRGADFHASMAAALLAQTERIAAAYRIERVGLTGGVFQNRRLSELALTGLEAAGFTPALGTELPANDAAICFGQAAELAARDANASSAAGRTGTNGR